MHHLLEKLLKKRGVESVKDLDPEEMATYHKWQATLTDKEVTLETFTKFCASQVQNIAEQLKNLENSPRKNERLILLLNVYSTLLDITKSREGEAQVLEEYLHHLLTVD